MKKSYALILILAVAGLAALWYWYGNNTSTDAIVSEANAILVQDQQPGAETTVTYAKLAQPGYVVVYATDSAGSKTMLGTSDLLPAGEHRNVVVRHRSSNSSNGSTVSAAIIIDDGDGVFSEESDTDNVAEGNAEISADAILDTDITDEELAELLDDAGYDLTEAQTEDTETAEEEENNEGAVGVEGEAEQDTSATIEETVVEEPAQ